MHQFERKLGVVLGIPSNGMWYAGFGTSLVGLLTHFMNTPVKGYREQKLLPASVVGSILPRSRKMCVETLLETKCSHVLWIDSDQTFPKDTLHRLLAHDKDIVGCNIAVKRIPSCPTAVGFDKLPVYTDLDRLVLEKVWSVGCGVLLMKRQVFETIGVRNFEMRWIDEINDYGGEDWAMLDAARKAGFDVWVDHKLSNEVGHLGTFEFTHDVVGEVPVNSAMKKEAGLG